MDAILPIIASEADRASSLLLPSLEKFYPELNTLWIICPPQQVAEIRSRLAFRKANVISETDLVPELDALERFGIPRVGGWYRQQIIKLAAVDLVQTDNFLTLDDDVFAVAPIRDAEIAPGGRPLRDQCREAETETGAPDVLATWLDWAAKVLRCRRLDYQPGVTPSILSRRALRQLADWCGRELAPTSRRWQYSRVAGVFSKRWDLRSWRGRLLVSLPWTEYGLYDTFLVSRGLFSEFHTLSTDLRLLGNAAWTDAEFQSWSPKTRDNKGRRILFNLVASRGGVTAESVAQRAFASHFLGSSTS